MTVTLIHPRLLSGMTRFFPERLTVEEKSATLDAYGQAVETWAAVVGWMDIPCAKAPLSANERQAASYTATDRAWHVLLNGAYPTITTRHRAVIDTDTHDIDAVETDQTGSITRLRVRMITT